MKRISMYVGLLLIAGLIGVNADHHGGHGFKSIFDGKTLDGWEVLPKKASKAWTVKDGTIRGNGDDGEGYLMYKKKKYSDLEIKLSYRFKDKGNSGIDIRARMDPTKKRLFHSYHADLGDKDNDEGDKVLGAWDLHLSGMGRKEHGLKRGLSCVIDKHDKAHFFKITDGLKMKHIKKNDWNHVHIIAKDNMFKFYINGKLASEFVELLSKKKRLKNGYITLQLHDPGMVVQFKDVRVREL